jgi:small subunit ribosomal protein S5
MATSPFRGGRETTDFGEESAFEDAVVKLYRCATVVKGGRRFSFGALVVVGDRRGQVGYGYGKANEVPSAVEKGVKLARRNLIRVPLRGTTITHRVVGKFGSSRIVMIPAAEGTGVIAGAAPRAVLQLAGVKNILTKCYGSTSPKNLVKATFDGLRQLRTRAQVEALRGVTLDLPPEPEAAPEPERVVVEAAPGGGRRGRGGRPGAAVRGRPAPVARPEAEASAEASAPESVPGPQTQTPAEGTGHDA